MEAARITVFAGHFGSGKTNLAINYAFWLKEKTEKVALCDLDIVNPYFRTADAREALEARGIKLITSQFANSNVDAPALPAETRSVFDDKSESAVIDLGGDERGALALGRYSKLMREEGNYEMLLVVNPHRPLTRTQDDLKEIVDEIEAACRVPFTGVVNNANLGPETTLSDIAATLPFAKEAAKNLGLPLKMTTVRQDLLAGGEELQVIERESEVFPIDIIEKPNWKL